MHWPCLVFTSQSLRSAPLCCPCLEHGVSWSADAESDDLQDDNCIKWRKYSIRLQMIQCPSASLKPPHRSDSALLLLLPSPPPPPLSPGFSLLPVCAGSQWYHSAKVKTWRQKEGLHRPQSPRDAKTQLSSVITYLQYSHVDANMSVYHEVK